MSSRSPRLEHEKGEEISVRSKYYKIDWGTEIKVKNQLLLNKEDEDVSNGVNI